MTLLKPKPERMARGLWWDRAWTLVDGCTQVSEACDHCWALREAARFARHPNKKISERYEKLTMTGADGEPIWLCMARQREEALDLPLRVKQPAVFAVWNDLFHEDVQDYFIDRAMRIMSFCERHQFMVCTKRIKRAREYFTKKWPIAPANMWLGTTVESGKHIGRIRSLCATPAAKRFVSAGPLLGPWSLKKALAQTRGLDARAPIDLLIVECESGLGARETKWEWVWALHKECEALGVAFFLKQMRDEKGKLKKAPWPGLLEWPK